jgi:hypothetical protein
MMDFLVEPNADGGADVVAVHRCKVATFVERDDAEAYADWRRAKRDAVDQRYALWLTGGRGAGMGVSSAIMMHAVTAAEGAELEAEAERRGLTPLETAEAVAAEALAAEARASREGELCDRCGDPIIDGSWCAGCPPEDPVAAAEAPATQAAGVAPPVAAAPADPYAPDGEAMRRLEAGEKLAVVADDLGLNMHRLRGHWSRRARVDQDAGAVMGDRPVMDEALPPTRAQPPKLPIPTGGPAPLPDGFVACLRCKTQFNAARAQRELKLSAQPTHCAGCRAGAA